MRWKSMLTPSAPLTAVLILGAIMGLAFIGSSSRARLSRAEKRELKRLSRKKGRSVTSKRASSKRKEQRFRLIQEHGIEVAKKMIQEDRQKKEEQQARLRAARDDPNSLRLVVDLAWADTLSDKELSSLRKQLCYVYGRVRSSASPPSLTLASYRGRASEILRRAGADSWLVDRNPSDVFELFDPRDVIYLSPDASEALEEVDPTNVYVIGGIVDRNLKRGITLAAAEGKRARTVRLPFDEYLPEVAPRDRVLTVVACVGVLISKCKGDDWREVLERSVPKRGMSHAARPFRGEALTGTDGSSWGRPAEDEVPEDNLTSYN